MVPNNMMQTSAVFAILWHINGIFIVRFPFDRMNYYIKDVICDGFVPCFYKIKNPSKICTRLA